MKIPTTLDRKTWKKWLICPTLAVLLLLTVLPVYANESQSEPTETIIAEEVRAWSNDCHICDHNNASAPKCIMTSQYDDLEARLMVGNLSEVYCSQCRSSVHEKGIPTHLEDHH